MEQKQNSKPYVTVIVAVIMSLWFLFKGVKYTFIGNDMTIYGVLLIVCGIVLIISSMFMLRKKNSDSKAEVIVTNKRQQSELNELQLRRKGLYFFEFTLIPAYVERLKQYPDETIRFVFVSIWKRDIASAVDQQYIDWSEISCEIFGDIRTECLLFYDFPTPFDIPLAKYGAVYINKQKQIYNYFTLEKSAKGYMLCSISNMRHFNYGETGDMSKIKFIKEVCNIQKIDEASLLEWRLAKSKSSISEYVDLSGKVNREFSEDDLKVLIELKDDDYQEFTANHSNIVVCFYELNNLSSKLMLNLLSEFAADYKDKIAVGIYNVYGDRNEIMRAKLNIMGMPTFLIYKNGEVIHKHIGICDRDTMKKMFVDLLS